MTDKVLLTFASRQYDLGEAGNTDVSVVAAHKTKGDCHYISYEDEDGNSVIKISPGQVEMIRRGGADADMLFKEGLCHKSDYKTAVFRNRKI